MRLIGGGHGAGPVIGDSPPNPLGYLIRHQDGKVIRH